MARRPSTFTKNDVSKAIRAVAEAGLEVAKISVGPDGMITVITTRETEQQSGGNAFDQWKAKRDAHPA